MKSWTNRDWKWFTSILVGIILLSFSILLSDANQLIQIFSFLSSGVSIALAFVAIYVSSNQNRESQSLFLSMNETLARLDEKIQSVNDKVDKIDVTPLIQNAKDEISEILSEFENKNDTDNKDVIGKINKKMDELKNEMNSKLHTEISSNKDKNSKILYSFKNHILAIGPRLNKLTATEIKEILYRDYGVKIGHLFLIELLSELVHEQFLVLNDDATYSIFYENNK